MEKQDALKKIEEINSIIKSSNKALFSGRHMMLYGLIVLSIPLVGYFTKWLTFGHDFGTFNSSYLAIANTAFFWGLSSFLGKIIPRSEAYAKQTIHPLIEKSFSITRPIVFSIIGSVVILSITNQAQLIYPFVLILLGLMFSIYGKFSIRVVSLFAWSYIFCGLLHLYLLKFDIPFLSFYFLVYNGASYIAMGFLLDKEEKSNA